MFSYFDMPSVRDAIARIEAGTEALVVLQEGRIVFSSCEAGIRAAMELHDQKPELLRGAVVADRIIGRAAAMIFTDGGAAAVYGKIMNRSAMQELAENGVEVSTAQLVDTIINRRGDGMCPMEHTVFGVTAPAEGVKLLRAALARLSGREGAK